MDYIKSIADKVLKLHMEGVSNYELAKKFNVSERLIEYIIMNYGCQVS